VRHKPSKEGIDDFIGMIMEKALTVKGSDSLQKAPADFALTICFLPARCQHLLNKDKEYSCYHRHTAKDEASAVIIPWIKKENEAWVIVQQWLA